MQASAARRRRRGRKGVSRLLPNSSLRTVGGEASALRGERRGSGQPITSRRAAVCVSSLPAAARQTLHEQPAATRSSASEDATRSSCSDAACSPAPGPPLQRAPEGPAATRLPDRLRRNAIDGARVIAQLQPLPRSPSRQAGGRADCGTVASRESEIGAETRRPRRLTVPSPDLQDQVAANLMCVLSKPARHLASRAHRLRQGMARRRAGRQSRAQVSGESSEGKRRRRSGAIQARDVDDDVPSIIIEGIRRTRRHTRPGDGDTRAERHDYWPRARAARARARPRDRAGRRSGCARFAEAYRLQAVVASDLGDIGGWKVAAVTARNARRSACGPIAGPLLDLDARCRDAARCGRRGSSEELECEFAFERARDLPPGGAPYAREEVAAAIAACGSRERSTASARGLGEIDETRTLQQRRFAPAGDRRGMPSTSPDRDRPDADPRA